ncbi:hypothetical protein [Campylobacter sp.]|uniref:hypothetical protein n=1 Tax=Campylobacter sp. TaxID=205 RepID=UPI002707225A|nr:hypothetical protein [Campylobacter sp.]
MKKIFAVLIFAFALSFGYEINFDKFYDENITNEEVDRELDNLLLVLDKNPNLINKEFGEYNERIFSFFIINEKIGRVGKFDFERIEKVFKFRPDLNYNMYKIDNSSPLHMAIALSFDHEIKNSISEDEILKLIKILAKNGADVRAKELLVTAYSTDKFEIFKHLLDNKARDTSKIMFSIAADIAIFIGHNGLSVQKKKIENSKEREFARTDKFKEFYESKIKFLKESLKFIELNEFNPKEIETFIIINSILDNDKAIEILLKNGLCELENGCKFLKEQAEFYDSNEILKLLK